MELYHRTPKGKLGRKNLTEGARVGVGVCTSSSSIHRETGERLNVSVNVGQYYVTLTREEILFLHNRLTK